MPLWSVSAWVLSPPPLGVSRQVGHWGGETNFLYRDVAQAQNVLSGQPYTSQHYPPGYAYVLAAVSLLTDGFFRAGIIISAVASTVFGLITYGIFTNLVDRRIAFVTTLFVVLALLPHSFVATTDMLANCMLLLPLWVLPSREPTMRVCIQSGLTAGLAYLVRYNAVFVLIGIPLALLFLSPAEDSLRRRFLKVVAFVTAALAVTAPWLLVNWQYHGNPFASDLYAQVAAHFYHPKGDGLGSSIEHMRQQFDSYWDVLFYDPARLIRKFLKDVFYDRTLKLAWGVIGFPSLLFAGAGVLLYIRDLTRSRASFLLVCGMGYLLHGLAGFADRFYFFLYPLLFLFVGLSVFELGRIPVWFREVRRVWDVSWMVIACLLIVSAYTASVQIGQFFRTVPVHLLQAAEILRARALPGDGIMGYKPDLAYLANLKAVSIDGLDSVEEYVERARRNHVRYIVYSEFEEQYMAGLHVLRDPALMPDDFRVIYEHTPTKTLVYEVTRAADSH